VLAPYRLLGDDRLVRLAEAGNEPAFAVIYGRYERIITGYCRSIVEDEHDSRDAMQNAMLKALVALRRQGGPRGPLRPWLFRIAHNESITLLRQRSRQPDELDESAPAPSGDAHRQAEARERLAEVLEDMKGLTSHQRGALVMRELGGMGYDEIGAALETSPLAARQAVFAARRALAVPRRALRALLPPVPAGLLASLLGGGGGGTVKVIAVAASIGAGVTAVELPHSPERRDRIVAVTPAPTAAPAKAAKRRAPKAATVKAVVRPAVAAPAATARTVPVARKVVTKRREQAVAAPRREHTRPRRERQEDAAPREDGHRERGTRRAEESFEPNVRMARAEDCPPPREGGPPEPRPEPAPAAEPAPAPQETPPTPQ
jgi:RNA polymerase sigma factor (sigma-70 family)